MWRTLAEAQRLSRRERGQLRADVQALQVQVGQLEQRDPADRKLLIGLCNTCFRCRRALNALRANIDEVDSLRAAVQGSPAAAAELEALGRQLDELDLLLKAEQAEYQDLTGAEPNAEIFAPVVPTEASPNVSRMTITHCDRPCIRIGGVVVQPAAGAAVRPLQRKRDEISTT